MHESPHVRLAAVVALRRMRSPEVADFIHDVDRRVADEAIRAIHDEAIEAVRPAVAALLDVAGVEKRTPFMLRRLVHSAFRCGGAANARRLVTVATAKKFPVEVRREALRLLALWPEPPPADQSTGHWAPLPKRDAAEILPVLQEAMPALLKVEGSLLAGVFGLAERFQLPLDKLDAAGLKSLVAQTSIPGAARAKALRVLADRNPPDLLPSLARFAADKDPAVAVEALRLLLDRFSKEAVKPLMAAVDSSNTTLAQAAWRALGTVQDSAVGPLFAKKLKDLRAKNGVSPVALELLEAARKRSEPEVKQALVDFDTAANASGDSLAKWLPSLEGGDANRGAALFQSHPASECMRCHRAELEGDHGGEAGPNLAGVARRGDRRFLLESLVLPSARISPGYGVLSVTLKNDAVLGGMLLEEAEGHVDLNASGKHWRVKRSDIKSLTPAFSAMPPMGHSLTPAELRDLVAWLAAKREEAPAVKASATPTVLDPESLLRK
jgi:quinoprotein glucose dehydrogenase